MLIIKTTRKTTVYTTKETKDMNIGDSYTAKITGKVVKKELYKDGKIRAWIQNETTDEMAIIIDSEVYTTSIQPIQPPISKNG
jgi:hypothetical protein